MGNKPGPVHCVQEKRHRICRILIAVSRLPITQNSLDCLFSPASKITKTSAKKIISQC